MEITYLGHSAFRLSAGDVTLVIDPWIEDNPDCDFAVEDFDDVTAVLITHGAFDHVGDAPEIARRNDAELFCDAASYSVLLDRDFPEDLLAPHIWGMNVGRDGWSVRIVEAHHQSAWPEEGVVGPALAYIVTLDGHTVYHMGDTSISYDFELFGELYEPEVTLIPVGGAEGYYPELYPDEAALVAEWLGSDVFVPMHYSDPAHPAEFEAGCAERGVEGDVVRMEPGETLAR